MCGFRKVEDLLHLGYRWVPAMPLPVPTGFFAYDEQHRPRGTISPAREGLSPAGRYFRLAPCLPRWLPLSLAQRPTHKALAARLATLSVALLVAI